MKSTNSYNGCFKSVVILQRIISWLPTDLYALHETSATPDKATHLNPLVNALATPKWTFRYR